MKTEEISLQQYRELTQKRARKVRGKREPATGLSVMLAQGWHYTFNPLHGDRLTLGALDTGWQPDEKSAVIAARLLLGRAGLRVGDET